MSLTTLIQYDEEWKSFFKSIISKKTDFKTLSGHSAFSNEYEELVEYKLSNTHYSNVVGTAFDYIARWIVARTVTTNREKAYEYLVAERGIYLCRYVTSKENINMRDTYEKALNTCKKFVNGKASKSEIIRVAILFAKLEHLVRRGAYLFDVSLDYILGCECEIIEDLEKLYDLFEKRFILSGLVTKESKVVYNPTFGGASVICGGADADIYIDGTLYDFKCTRKHGYVWNEVAQIFGYYLLDGMAKHNNDEDNCLKGYEIRRIAFYRARYGEIEYIDVSNGKYQRLIDSFELVFGKEKYSNYYEEERKRREMERLEQEKREREEKERLQKEQEELEKNIAIYHKMKKFFYHEEQFDQIVRQCKNEEQKKRVITSLVVTYYNSRVYDKIDSEKIKQIMQRENITVDEISKKLNRTSATVKKWIAGRSTPPLGIYIELLDMLKCNRIDIAEPINCCY